VIPAVFETPDLQHGTTSKSPNSAQNPISTDLTDRKYFGCRISKDRATVLPNMNAVESGDDYLEESQRESLCNT
jgi:hypothetical protein